MSDHQGTEGILSSLQSLFATLVAIFHNRLQLLSNDLEIARTQLISTLTTLLVTLFALCFGVLLLAIFVVVIFWDTHRLLALGLVTSVFLLVGVICLWRLINKLKTMPATFEASLAELLQDYKSLKDE
jgi:uncharacterized membrane protein YqjE